MKVTQRTYMMHQKAMQVNDRTQVQPRKVTQWGSFSLRCTSLPPEAPPKTRLWILSQHFRGMTNRLLLQSLLRPTPYHVSRPGLYILWKKKRATYHSFWNPKCFHILQTSLIQSYIRPERRQWRFTRKGEQTRKGHWPSSSLQKAFSLTMHWQRWHGTHSRQ